ncbi:MAG: MFS transporter [Candidatus Hodarchaeales archaeon]|jgi:MFS family permease
MMINTLENEKLNRKTGKEPLLVLFFAVMLDLLGFGMVFPILPFWVTNIIGTSEFVFGILLATYSTMTFLFAPVWGRISDRSGRRPVILTGLTMSMLGFTVMFITAIFFIDNLLLLFLSRMIAGIGAAAVLPIAQAYISDSTTGKERNKGFAMIGAAFGLGFALGPAFGSIFTFFGEILVPSMKGYWAPALFAIGLTVVNLLAAKKNLPESLTDEKRNTRTGLNSKTSTRTLIRSEGNLLVIIILIGVFGMIQVSISSLESTMVLFGNLRFGLNELFAGLLLLVFGVVGIITQGGAIKRLSKRFSDAFLVVSGLFFLILGFIGLTTIINLESMMLWIVILSIGTFLALPTINAFLSKQAPNTVQGTVMGINQSVGALMRIIGPLLATFLFEIGEVLPYVTVILILMVTLVVAISLTRIPSETGHISEISESPATVT